jgi:hypothetical protein
MDTNSKRAENRPNKGNGNGKDFDKKDQRYQQSVPDGSGLLLGQVMQIYKDMYKDQLDLVEQILIITAPEKKDVMYRQLRARVLRIGNNALRSLSDEFKKYSIRPKQVVHDIIVPPDQSHAEVKHSN